MSCLPGMPCYDAYRIAFPFSCGDPCQSLCFTSDKIIYNGPNLACTGIQSQDNLEVALQKIDDRMCSDEFISHIIVAIEDNPVLKAYFCQLVSSCPIPTTTTTSSTSSTTTTTTTAIPTTTTTTTPEPTTTTTSSTTSSSTTTTTTSIAPTTTTTTTTVSGYTIGESALGGKIAYILQPGDPGYVLGEQHGFVATVADLAVLAEWGCNTTVILGADGTALGTGAQNTIDIVAECPTAGIAARLCNDLVEGGYSDWYLPSKDELNKLYLNRVAIGGFVNNNYWSSSEFDAFNSWWQQLGTGFQNANAKAGLDYIRPIRSF